METNTNKHQKKDTIMAKTTKTREQMIADETKFMTECGLDEATATLVATNKVDKILKDKQEKEELAIKNAEEAKKQEALDKAELERVAALAEVTLPTFVTRFVVSTVAITEEQEIDGKKEKVEIGRKPNKVRLYLTVDGRSSEINSLIKTFEKQEELDADIEGAKIALLKSVAK